MYALQQSNLSSNSLSPPVPNSELGLTMDFVKNLLKSRIFLGRYVERRFVNKQIGYRDLIVVSRAETELIKNLSEVQQRLDLHKQYHWIGITDTDFVNLSPYSICLWTELDNIPLGPSWFQIKSVIFTNIEVMVKVKCLRHISEAFLEAEPILTGAGRQQKIKTSGETSETPALTLEDVKVTLKNSFTLSNFIECLKFVFACAIGLVVGANELVYFFGNFIVTLVREMSNLVTNSTPLFLGILNFFSKVVGGFYILLAMMFRPSNPNISNGRMSFYDEQQHHNRRSSIYNTQQHPSSIKQLCVD